LALPEPVRNAILGRENAGIWRMSVYTRLRSAAVLAGADRGSEQQLRAAAGTVVRMEEGNGAFGEMALKLLQIDAAHREPCPEP